MQSQLTIEDNCHCEALAHNNLEGFYFFKLDVLGYKHVGLHCMPAEISCSWVN